MAADPVPFDAVAERYDEELAAGLRLSGEGKEFFRRGRLAALGKYLPEGAEPTSILDFGCGLGDTSAALCERFERAQVVGVDQAPEMLRLARARYSHPRLAFLALEDLAPSGGFDLCYVNGVFHHVPQGEQVGVARLLARALRPGGFLALFENNPLNPGTRLVMRRIAFDRDAVPLFPWTSRRLLRAAGYQAHGPTRYLFFFPRTLGSLRPLEPLLTRLPLGGQYLILARAS